ncbi:hypothetical protein L3N51_01798 [Metallosphaera sp. J1]|uniref:hypothetical protein n=1 Tax=Metallosphaera TaxID=41980 RepID=UPI001EE01EBD|nr:hypothetical protein [Metallosphaera javensis (ex Hofmann et al. 2022)]MCG3109505.1 hypothetical protein [Metallosphaera javensis (ex Hofmann et al. 2022)]BCS94162.1 MAG: hypothetical protein MjAS7_2770 [Metallosphaera javensis (ex Sakai et al. 2022)]
MPWNFLKKDKRRFERDKFGEWAIVGSNKELSFLVNTISKAVSKTGSKKNEIYVLQYLKDPVIPNLFSLKGMVETSYNVSEMAFQDSLRKIFDDLGNVGEIRTVKVRLCNDIFLFFNFNFIAKKVKNSTGEVKLLIPPLGVSSSQIPYTVEHLFNAMMGNEGDQCSVETDFMDSRMAKLTFNCKKVHLDHFRVRESFSYFLDDAVGFRLKTRSSNPQTTEIEIVLLNLRRESLIPLLWDNFLSIYPSC